MRSTNVLVAALLAITLPACGEDSSSGAQGGTRVAAVGDSITAGAPLWDPDPATRQSLGDGADEKSQYEYWAERKLGDVRFRNCGVPGDRTDEIALRFDACTKGAEVVIVQGGGNDVSQGRRAESAAGDLRKMVQRGKQRGLRVAITTVTPLPGYGPQLRRLNGLIAQMGAQEDVPVIDFNRAVADPSKPGLMRKGYVSDDQIHPTVAGYQQLGEVVELP